MRLNIIGNPFSTKVMRLVLYCRRFVRCAQKTTEALSTLSITKKRLVDLSALSALVVSLWTILPRPSILNVYRTITNRFRTDLCFGATVWVSHMQHEKAASRPPSFLL